MTGNRITWSASWNSRVGKWSARRSTSAIRSSRDHLGLNGSNEWSEACSARTKNAPVRTGLHHGWARAPRRPDLVIHDGTTLARLAALVGPEVGPFGGGPGRPRKTHR